MAVPPAIQIGQVFLSLYPRRFAPSASSPSAVERRINVTFAYLSLPSLSKISSLSLHHPASFQVTSFPPNPYDFSVPSYVPLTLSFSLIHVSSPPGSLHTFSREARRTPLAKFVSLERFPGTFSFFRFPPSREGVSPSPRLKHCVPSREQKSNWLLASFQLFTSFIGFLEPLFLVPRLHGQHDAIRSLSPPPLPSEGCRALCDFFHRPNFLTSSPFLDSKNPTTMSRLFPAFKGSQKRCFYKLSLAPVCSLSFKKNALLSPRTRAGSFSRRSVKFL